MPMSLFMQMYSILIEDVFEMSRDVLMNKLEKKGIETRTFFIPMHEQPVFQNMDLFKFKGKVILLRRSCRERGCICLRVRG